MACECGAEHGAKQEAGAYRSRRRKLAWRLMAPQDFLKMELSFPVTEGGANVSLQLFIGKIILSLINNDTRINLPQTTAQ